MNRFTGEPAKSQSLAYGLDNKKECRLLGITLKIAAVAQFFIPEKTMTEMTLRRPGAATETGLAQVLKEFFSATPLGLVLAALRAR
jgi:hypothetical protein